jgi:hypothetical protein
MTAPAKAQATALSREEYEATQSQLLLFAGLLRELPLAAFLEAIGHAHAVAPILDPTLYMRGMDNLTAIEQIADALHVAQRKIEAVAQREAARAGRRG